MAIGYYLRVGDKTTCGGRILTGDPAFLWYGVAAALEGSAVSCGKVPGVAFKILGGTADAWDNGRMLAGTLDSVSSCPCRATFIPSIPDGYQRAAASTAAPFARAPVTAMALPAAASDPAPAVPLAVFAKSCLRGDGCTDAGEEREPHTHFAPMAILQAVPAAEPASDATVPQHAQAAKKKPVAPEDIPEPKKRSALWRWWNGNHEVMNYLAAKADAESAARAEKATAGASVLVLAGGRAAVAGTWAIGSAAGATAGVATAGAGTMMGAFLIGMFPRRLNQGESDFITPLLLEQIAAKRGTAPTRVRFSWESDSNGNPVPQGWHTPAGQQDRVRVRKMAWDSARQAYTFTTEEEKPVTIIWTPDHSGVSAPSNTGNQVRPMLPDPIMVDPLPDNTSITATTSPAPEERDFADYILILPLPDMPPVYIYLSRPPVEFLEVGRYSDFNRRSRQGKYEADHMPSAAAVRAYLKANAPEMLSDDVDKAVQNVAAIVVPKEVHQKLSETYGGRNTPAQIELDSHNLRAAVDRNLDAIKPILKEHGATEIQIEAARARMHEVNSDMGLYK